MSMARWSAAELRALGEGLMTAGLKIVTVSDRMTEESFPELVLQAQTAITIYAPSIFNLASLIETEYKDQHEAVKFNRPARWENNQKKVEARMARKQTNDAMMETRKPAPRKKPPKEHARKK